MSRLLIVILCTITLFLPQTVFAKSKIDTARDYAKIEKNSEARQLLAQAILDDPLDADVHYEAGLVYGQLGMNGDFDLAMKNACKLKSSYCPKVAEPYYSMGLNYLNNASKRPAIKAFEKAFAYNPARKQEVITEIYSRGGELLSNKNIALADSYFVALTVLEPSYNDKIADIYFNEGKLLFEKNNTKDSFFLFRLAKKYSAHHNNEIGKFIIDYAIKNQEDCDFMPELKSEAMLYLSESEVNASFPVTHVELPPNQWFETKPLKNQELSKVWWGSQRGYPIKIRIGSHDGKKYSIYLEDKSEYPNFNSIPKEKIGMYFKFRAQEDDVICAARFDR